MEEIKNYNRKIKYALPDISISNENRNLLTTIGMPCILNGSYEYFLDRKLLLKKIDGIDYLILGIRNPNKSHIPYEDSLFLLEIDSGYVYYYNTILPEIKYNPNTLTKINDNLINFINNQININSFMELHCGPKDYNIEIVSNDLKKLKKMLFNYNSEKLTQPNYYKEYWAMLIHEVQVDLEMYYNKKL